MGKLENELDRSTLTKIEILTSQLERETKHVDAKAVIQAYRDILKFRARALAYK